MKKIVALLENTRGKELSREERAKKTAELATLLLEETLSETKHSEKTRLRWLSKMIADPKGKAFVTAVTDQCFRSHLPKRTADQLKYLLSLFGIPRFLKEGEQLKMFFFKLFGTRFPTFFVPRMKREIHNEMSPVLLPEDPASYFSFCQKQSIRINLNHIGEAILGEEEAERRVQIYLEDLKHPQIEYVSIKISTIFSQINMIGWDASLRILSDRLRALYRAAREHLYSPPSGEAREKFVNLDMEEYKDLDLTIALFKKVLSEPEFKEHSAGMVLQSYIPDSFAAQQELTVWAQERVARGGAPIKLRLVKGANLAMEQVESSLHIWPQAPFEHKLEADAHFKKMVEYGFEPAHAKAVRIGIGSHNLFDIAYALLLSFEKRVEMHVDFEMLKGMAEPMQRVLMNIVKEMILYCPEARAEDFQYAVAYLIRRLDENTGPENFLRHLFDLKPQSAAWETEKKRFLQSINAMDSLSTEKRRIQNRLQKAQKKDLFAPFEGEPDTDFSLEPNRRWAEEILKEWERKTIEPIPLVLGKRVIKENLTAAYDPSRPGKTLYMYAQADAPLAVQALAIAKANETGWREMSMEERSSLLGKAAQLLRERRGELLGAMLADGGKIFLEGDPEVSEAIDFIEYYRRSGEEMNTLSDLTCQPKGTLLVAPPWNFPCSIPAGGVAAALIAGNCVLFKPAPESVLVGWHLVQAFWDAGIPKEVLQFINCPDEPVGSQLIQDPRLSGVILTGATTTAKKLLGLRPGLDLMAETGGKNPLIITGLSDRDLAIRDLVHSAFGHAGQKCSACSLAVLEAEVYDDPHFLGQLRDAAASLAVGSAWNPKTRVPPLIRPAEGALLRGMTTLEKGESWLLKPQVNPENPQLWSPGIKLGVREGSFTHQTEMFGPLLGVMRAENLPHALRLANGTPYGLTSGLHSLDTREHTYWKERIVAGNLYINRGITGAIIQRQPFGGCKASSFGPGEKAGGPYYVAQCVHKKQMDLPQEGAPLPPSLIPLVRSLPAYGLDDEQRNLWKRSVENYAYWAPRLKEPTDVSLLLGQDNFYYHVPLEQIFIFSGGEETILDSLRSQAAALICTTPFELIEKEEEMIHLLKQGKRERVRLLTPASEPLAKAAAESGTTLITAPVLANGRFELLHYLRPISISTDTHRYGYLDPCLPIS